jgi:hypothetical protein
MIKGIKGRNQTLADHLSYLFPLFFLNLETVPLCLSLLCMESGVVAKDDNDNEGFGIGIATGDNMTQQKDAMAKT